MSTTAAAPLIDKESGSQEWWLTLPSGNLGGWGKRIASLGPAKTLPKMKRKKQKQRPPPNNKEQWFYWHAFAASSKNWTCLGLVGPLWGPCSVLLMSEPLSTVHGRHHCNYIIGLSQTEPSLILFPNTPFFQFFCYSTQILLSASIKSHPRILMRSWF